MGKDIVWTLWRHNEFIWERYKCNTIDDNVVIPQNDLPILNAEMANIPLLARARRIAIYYKDLKSVA